MQLASEAERRIDRSRQIVARQQELVAMFGGRRSLAVELLKTYEQTLALLEETLAVHRLRYEETRSPCAEHAGAIVSMSDHEEQMREVARLMEILRGGGFHCELAQETLH